MLWPMPATGFAHRVAPCTMMNTSPPPEADESSHSLPFKALLLAVAVGYGTNFPVGRIMNGQLPAAATTSGRFALAALVLSPFIPRLDRALVVPALLTGLFDAFGYCAQSVDYLVGGKER